MRGFIDDGINVFRGIPFAGDVSGEGRWRPPGPAPHWQGVRDGTRHGPICPQSTQKRNGVLHYTDSRMLMGLRDALEYMCKEGTHSLVKEGMGHNLRKSQSPKRSEGELRRGAPRKQDPELSAARQVLLTPDPLPAARNSREGGGRRW